MVKNSVGNREAKELICTAHGHELKVGRNAGGWGKGAGRRGDKGEEKNWEKYNSIINKIYLKRRNNITMETFKIFCLFYSKTFLLFLMLKNHFYSDSIDCVHLLYFYLL